MEVFESKSLADTERIAQTIAEKVKRNGFLALYGGMGAGKTAFVHGLVKALCPECLDLVHSPTFAIVNEYRGKDIDIFHFDLYRLTDEDDLYSTGFYDYIEQGGLTVTEWTELFESAIPNDALRLRIEPIDETTRRFTLC